ncbi:MAG: hypothetical protein HYZ71_15985 [Deltaproteobacteria bacterium]|nr:hypothetical protein [Deltaproteobacteria bacterium]
MKTLKWSTQSDLCQSVLSKSGGLFHFQGEAIPFALSLVTTPQRGASPSPSSTSGGHFLWISDEGFLNPAALVARRVELPLSRLIIITPPNAKESWSCAIEAAQSGLFSYILFRPSQTCQGSTGRILQLASEKSATCVLILAPVVLPHWVLKASIEGA